jgi:predicted transcriptional regulator
MAVELDASATPGVLSTGIPEGLPPSPSGQSTLVHRDREPAPPLIKKPTRKFNPKPPKGSKVRKAVLVYLALKAQGFKMAEIAEHLGLTTHTVSTYVKKANAAGWINLDSFDDPTDKLEYVLKSKAVRNINEVLDERVTDAESGASAPTDRASEVAMKVAHGTGLLKQYQVTKSDSVQTVGVALKVQVEMPPNASTPVIQAGSIGGQPAFDAEIIE